VRKNIFRRVQSSPQLNFLSDTLTSAWDAMRANFGVGPKASQPPGWVTYR
jgi:hypothetical protein